MKTNEEKNTLRTECVLFSRMLCYHKRDLSAFFLALLCFVFFFVFCFATFGFFLTHLYGVQCVYMSGGLSSMITVLSFYRRTNQPAAATTAREHLHFCNFWVAIMNFSQDEDDGGEHRKKDRLLKSPVVTVWPKWRTYTIS